LKKDLKGEKTLRRALASGSASLGEERRADAKILKPLILKRHA